MIYSIVFLIAVGLFSSPLSFGDSIDELEKERIQLDKQRKIFEDNLQTIQNQINELSSILNDLKNNDVSNDKIEDIEEQLEELYDDKSKLEKSETDLLEREAIFKEKWNDVSSSPSITNTSDDASIPDWFKSNAKWWKQGLISDGDIINALESLIIQDIIPLDKFVKSHSGLEHAAGVSPGGTFVIETNDEPKIPTYQKDVFGYWSDGQVSDSEIVNSIGHLMAEGIINSAKIQAEISERQAKFDQKMAELDKVLDSDSKFMDKIDGDDGSTTVTNPDGSKTVVFEDKSSTTFFPDGSRITNIPNGMTMDPFGLSFTIDKYHTSYQESGHPTISKIIVHPDGSRDLYQFVDTKSFEAFEFATSFAEGLLITDLKSDSIVSTPSSNVGGMQQLSQITTLTIDGIQFPISQFTIWKWSGECDDAWHYHTPTAQAISADGETGIVDPDQENCGFGKVGEVFVGTWFMSQDEIDKFRDRTDSDPLTNEAMMGGSDDESTPVDVNPGPASIEESDSGSKITSSKSDILTDYEDFDGDGIADEIDDSPYLASTTFGSLGTGLPGEILDLGGLEVRIIGSDEFGVLTIEITDDGSMFKSYEDGEAPHAIIQVLGVDLEMEPGIYEFSFG
ncbi:hypothetical protein C5F47_02985 [Nitrosopumilus cobalaminigenes]|uniref:Uncharacterized protein n=1 Tax=Nitrosopumilus cobalaminigenes TaxID=1470066 RepID=A0A7D5R0H9_9ARCH|nr:hypothetical protein C5F47_02985 [Nitrosopumilus cobalaminigenes]